MGCDIVGDAVHLDLEDGSDKGLADDDGIFGAEVIFDLHSSGFGLLYGGYGDWSYGLGLYLIYFEEDVSFFFLMGGEGFAEGVGYAVGGDGFCSVGNCFSDGGKLGGV